MVINQVVIKFSKWFNKFLPFLGISAIFYFFVILIIFLFHYVVGSQDFLLKKINPLYLLLRYDALQYLSIAFNGYDNGANIVFFPLYPILVRFFSFFIDPLVAGFLISFICLAIAFYFLKLLLIEEKEEVLFTRTVLLLLSFHTAIFFASLYTEALFLAISVIFFYSLKKQYWLTAAIIGFFATLTRNVGLFLWPTYLLVLFFYNHSFLINSFRHKFLKFFKRKEFFYSFIIPAGLLVYASYCYYKTGDFLAFFHQQSAWSDIRIMSWPGAGIVYLFRFIFLDPDLHFSLYNILVNTIFYGGTFLLLLITTIYWLQKKHWAYSVFCLLNVLLFSCITPMVSVNRYVVVIFPIFIFLAKITLKKDWIFYSLFVLFIIFFIFCLNIFSTGKWVA